MAEVDWTDLAGSALNANDMPRGVSVGFTVPNGGGTFVHGYRSGVSTEGFGGKRCAATLTNYGPIPANKGGVISAAMKRYASGAYYAPMIGFMMGTDPTTAQAYMLGLSEADAYQIVLRKGVSAAGLDAADSSVLRTSTLSWTTVGDAAEAWKHLRLEVLVNPHDEVILIVKQNDLAANAVTAAVWEAVDGMDDYVDDSIGILTGSLPYLGSFYPFYGMYTAAAGSQALFDHIVVARQTSP
jgi:hypothetical protein